jgi:glycosyltransferase involved in cell wall biosynthesis
MKSAALRQPTNIGAVLVSEYPSQPFRILYFDHTAMLGGGEIALFNVIRYMDRQLVTPVVVLCSEGPLADRLRDICDVHILSLPEHVRNRRKDSLGWKSLLKLRDIAALVLCSFRLARLAAQQDVSLIHTNSLKADIIGGIAGRLAGRPVVWHVHDRIEEDYLPKPMVRAFRFLCGFLPSYVIANSQAVLETLHLKRSRPQTAISPGVELPKCLTAASRAVVHPEGFANGGAEKQVIALIGRICPWKGQHVFLQAAAAVRRRFPNAIFKIVGAALFGEEQYEAELRRLCTELDMNGAIEFTGFCSNVTGLIAELDLVVHASTIAEPFGQVIVEGMAAAKPIVATNGGGVPEIVLDNVTGFLVPMGDASAMAEAICKIVADRALARRMGLHGLKRARDLFSIESTAQKVEAVYRQLLEAT